MKAINAHFKTSLFLFILVIHSNISFTQITPWGNTTVHFGEPISMSVSDDGKYLLSADKEGYVTIWDRDTNKAIRNHHLSELHYAFFEPNTYNVIIIHEESLTNTGGSLLKLSKIVFQKFFEDSNIETLFTQVYDRTKFYFDISPNRDKILVLHDNFLEELRITEDDVKASVFFDAEEAHYSSDNEKVQTVSIKEGVELRYDGNNKTIYKDSSNSNFEYTNHARGLSINIDPIKVFNLESEIDPDEEFNDIFDDEYVFDFSFSPDGSSVGLTLQDARNNILDLVLMIKSNNEYKIRWKKTFGDTLFQSFTDVGVGLICWLDNERFVLANTPQYAIVINKHLPDLIEEEINNDYRVYPSIDFNKDLSKLIFSNQEGTFELDLMNSENVSLVDSISNRYVNYTVEDKIMLFEYLRKKTCKDDWIKSFSEDKLSNNSIHFPFLSIGSSTIINNRYTICSYIFADQDCAGIDLFPDELIFNSSGRQVGFLKDNVKYYSDQPEHIRGNLSSPILGFSGHHIIIENTESNEKYVLLNRDFCDPKIIDVHMSSDQSYFSYRCSGNLFSYTTFDLQEGQIIGNVESSISYINYSPHTNIACSLNRRGQMTIWDHQYNDTLFTKDLGFEFDQGIINTQFIESENIMLYQLDGKVFSINYKYQGSQPQLFFESSESQGSYQLTDDDEYLYSENWDVNFVTTNTTINILNRKTLESIYTHKFEGYNTIVGASYKHTYFSEKDPIVFIYNGSGEFRLIDLSDGSLLFTLKLIGERDWLAFSPQGYFDASTKGRESLYYVLGDEVILYDQIKERFWEPGLMRKIFNNPKYFEGREIESLDLFPEAKSLSLKNDSEIELILEPRSGGIGKTSLYINDKEVSENINPDTVLNLVIDLNDYEQYLYKSGLNIIGVKNYNKEEWVSSRTQKLYTEPLSAAAKDTTTNRSQHKVSNQRRRRSSSIEKPGLFALFIGTSEYSNPKLNLDFADQDALELKNAFNKIGKDFYKISGHKPVTLTSTATNTDSLSSRENILRELTFIEENAHINDIVVLFLSGHGITIDDDFYYLTSKAGNINLTKNVSGRKQVCISSKEILESLRRIKANKQILVFDACHSGKIADFLSNKSKALSTSQKKALESIKDKMGIYILASSEANQKSFEVQKLNQGLLTHSLLLGMSGQADKSDVTIDIVKLLSYASQQTEEVSKNVLGISQRPVIGIGEGGSSFSIGFKNESLKPPVPSDYVKIGNGKFGILPSLHDPIHLQNTFNNVLNNQGIFGGTQEFIFLENDFRQEAHKLTGTYEILANGELKIKLYILKENVFLGGPFEFKTSKKELNVTINEMIHEAVSFIKENE